MYRLRKAIYDRRRGIGITAAVAAGTYFICQYLSSKLTEIQDQNERDRVARETLRRKFYQTLQDCTFTVMALLPTLEPEIEKIFGVQAITEELKLRSKHSAMVNSGVISENSLAPSSDTQASENGATSMHRSAISNDSSMLSFSEQSSDADGLNNLSSSQEKVDIKISELKIKSKKDLWNDLKCKTFAQTIGIYYAVSLLTLITHIQLSNLGRESYMSSLIALARSRAPVPFEVTDQNNNSDKVYLSLSWWFIYVGFGKICQHIDRTVESVLNQVSLKDSTNKDQINEWINKIRSQIEEALTIDEMIELIFPMNDQTVMETLNNNDQKAPGGTFIELIHQTRETLSSEDFKNILNESLNKNFNQLNNTIYNQLSGTMTDDRVATQLPKIKKCGQLALQSVPNELVENISNNDDLIALDALILTNYESSIENLRE